MNKKAILVVSFGTSYADTRKKTIEKIEQSICEAYPDYQMRRAFTSRMIIHLMKEREGVLVNTEKEALEQLLQEGYEEVIIQPTHVIHGFEYDKIVTVAGAYVNDFKILKMGRPLLSRMEDYSAAARILWNEASHCDTSDSGLIYMGHGSEHPANQSYGMLEEELRKLGGIHTAIGTVEGEPEIHDIVELVKLWSVPTLNLYPLMIVAGDHACQDMAGDDEDSWKMILKHEGYQVNCVLKGLGEYEDIQREFVKRVSEAEMLNVSTA